MKKFTKQRVFIIFFSIIISLVVYIGQKTQSNGRNERNIGDAVQVTTLPVSGKVVILDAGHGTPDEGAESNNGTTEAQINLKIVLKIQELLEQSGCTVILTRSNENAIYDLDAKTLKQKKVSDIHNRVKIGNESSADIFVSIHLNKISQQQYYGWQTFYNTSNEQSKVLAEQIQENLNESIQKENNRVAMKLNTVYIMKHVEIPISIVECGFLSNPQEEKQLQDEEYQNRLAWGIYTGITSYFKNE